MGYRVPIATAMVDLLLGGRPEMKLLIMDQVFPENPIQPGTVADDDEFDADAPGTKP